MTEAKASRRIKGSGEEPEHSFALEEFESLSSINLELGSNGKYRWSIKVYFQLGEEVDAVSRVGSIDNALRSKYGGP